MWQNIFVLAILGRMRVPGLRLLGMAAVLGGSVAQVGCSSQYRPRVGPRIAVTMQGGNLAYERDGQVFEHGLFGAGLVAAVETDPVAREAAETYHERMVGGIVADLAGVACFIGGVAWAANVESTQSESFDLVDDKQRTIFLGATACLLAGTITGLTLLVSAQPYQWDAINIYNDNAEARGRPQPLAAPIAPTPAAPAPAPSAPPDQ